ncbi:MAG: type II toxin-antitoxin system RelE/ParE family toxin [Flavobacterium sp.]
MDTFGIKRFKRYIRFYKNVSPTVAKKIKSEILIATKKIVFQKQFQKDSITPNFRRIIVRHYKIIYTLNNDSVAILKIFDSRQNPEQQKKDL